MAKGKQSLENKTSVAPIVAPVATIQESSPKMQDVYFVANGKYLNTLLGIVGPGEVVDGDFFPGGMETIREHIANGILCAKGSTI